jgi:putative ABC transport system permease protein
MNLLENIREGLRSVRANGLRTVLTAAIIAIGISSLVGILTAIEGIQGSVNDSFAGLGANTFDIRGPQQFRRRRGGLSDQQVPPIDFRQAVAYKQRFGTQATISLSTSVTGTAQVKYESKKSNPNVSVTGIDENHFAIKALRIQSGRNVTPNDLLYATNVAVLGSEVVSTLFQGRNPIGSAITVLGQKFQVVGVLEKKGNSNGGGDDRQVFLPLETAKRLAGNRKLTFDITTSAPDLGDIEVVMGEARGTMRLIRGDRIGRPDSFEMERADAVLEEFDAITGYLRLGGFGIGFITLLGASIALMNIMMVSVTERTQEIGIRKSLGATPRRIREQFLIEAIVICLLGGLGGIVLALGIGNGISQLITQGDGSFVVPWLWMSLGLLICVIVGILSGFYPAFKASKLDPIESLRYE